MKKFCLILLNVIILVSISTSYSMELSDEEGISGIELDIFSQDEPGEDSHIKQIAFVNEYFPLGNYSYQDEEAKIQHVVVDTRLKEAPYWLKTMLILNQKIPHIEQSTIPYLYPAALKYQEIKQNLKAYSYDTRRVIEEASCDEEHKRVYKLGRLEFLAHLESRLQRYYPENEPIDYGFELVTIPATTCYAPIAAIGVAYSPLALLGVVALGLIDAVSCWSLWQKKKPSTQKNFQEYLKIRQCIAIACNQIENTHARE